jgi:glyoxylase-like metal-dependent hydrolase (beta-lactamase superfamily II)
VTLVVEDVEPGVTRLHLSSWTGRRLGYEVSAYLLRGVLVDTGFTRLERELLQAVDALAPRGAVITHWHEDHAGNAQALAQRRLPVLMHPACEATLRARPGVRAYRHVVWGQSPRLVAPLEGFDPSPLEILPFPGHADDHLGVWDAERRILLSGDLFLGVKVRVAHRHERPRRLLDSLRTAAALEPRLLLDAHRGPVPDATAKLRAKIAWLGETIEQIERARARGDDSRTIARRVLGREAGVGYASRGEYSKLAFVRAVLEEQ